MGPGDFSHPDHIPAFLDEVVANASPEVLAACGNNTECIFDASQTGEIGIGLETLAIDDNNRKDQAIAGESVYTSFTEYIVLNFNVLSFLITQVC